MDLYPGYCSISVGTGLDMFAQHAHAEAKGRLITDFNESTLNPTITHLWSCVRIQK